MFKSLRKPCSFATRYVSSADRWIQEKFSEFEGGIMISSITSLASYVLLSCGTTVNTVCVFSSGDVLQMED